MNYSTQDEHEVNAVNVRTMLRATAAAVAIVVMVLGSPVGLALAAPNDPAAESCKRRGYVWHDTWGCGDKKCEYNGKNYGNGDVIKYTINTSNGSKSGAAYCNGWNGNWVVVWAAPDPDPSRADPTQPLPSFEPTP